MDFIILMPFYNEEQQIPITVETLLHMQELQSYSYRLLLVDDGSKDNTWSEICKAVNTFPQRVRGIHLSRNFGKEAAICAGLDLADADAVILMDGDLQHPPSKIPEMLALWREGYEVVEGVKSSRGKESAFHRMSANSFYGLFKKISGINLQNASDFKLLDRKVVQQWRGLKEQNTFFRGLSQWLGFKRTNLPFIVEERQTGTTRWSMRQLFKLSSDAITAFSAAPLHLITFIGVLFMIGAVILTCQTLVRYFSGTSADGFTTVIMIQLMIGACIMISLGLIGTYIGKIFEEVKNRPRYIVSEDTDDIFHQ